MDQYVHVKIMIIMENPIIATVNHPKTLDNLRLVCVCSIFLSFATLMTAISKGTAIIPLIMAV